MRNDYRLVGSVSDMDFLLGLDERGGDLRI